MRTLTIVVCAAGLWTCMLGLFGDTLQSLALAVVVLGVMILAVESFGPDA